jgi:hypothetical protein
MALRAACRLSRAAAPRAEVLRVDILDRHAERRADPGERIDHQPDQGAVAQACLRRRVDAAQQRPRFGRIEHRRLPGRHDMARPAHRWAGLIGTTWPLTSQSNNAAVPRAAA